MRTEKQSNGTAHSTKNCGASPLVCTGVAWRAAACLLALAGSLQLTHACTPVSGYVYGETWTSANSPYCVMGDVYVLGLTIQSNVTVRFDGNYEFEVGGQLQVSGTASAPVIFTPSTTNGWKGILFRDATPGSFFNYATIERANRGGVRITNTSPVFTNCIIRNNTSQEGGGGICALVAGDTLIVQGCQWKLHDAKLHHHRQHRQGLFFRTR